MKREREGERERGREGGRERDWGNSSPRAFSEQKISVGYPSVKRALDGGDRMLGSRTTRSGWLWPSRRGTRRTVSPGSSRHLRVCWHVRVGEGDGAMERERERWRDKGRGRGSDGEALCGKARHMSMELEKEERRRRIQYTVPTPTRTAHESRRSR